jgi:hypothetical protein
MIFRSRLPPKGWLRRLPEARPVVTEHQEKLFEDQPPAQADPAPAVDPARIVANVERYIERSWRAAEKLIEGDDPDGLFAIGRAYYGLYNACLFAAMAFDIDRTRYRQGSKHHEEQDAIFHSQLAVLASDLVKAVEPPATLGGTTERAQKAFTLCRKLQKYRKRADYMGLETVTVEVARECIDESKIFVKWLWGHIREHYDLKST